MAKLMRAVTIVILFIGVELTLVAMASAGTSIVGNPDGAGHLTITGNYHFYNFPSKVATPPSPTTSSPGGGAAQASPPPANVPPAACKSSGTGC